MNVDGHGSLRTTYFTHEQLQNSPSRADGIDADKEDFFARSMYLFLQRMATELKLNLWVVHTAYVYCLRYYARRSYAKNDRYLLAAAALFMASKTMDGPRPVAHVAHAYFKVKYANKKDELEALHRDPAKKLAEYDLINSILFAERALLYTLNFQIKVDLPMNQLWKTASQVGIFTFTRQGELRDGEVNESMLTKEQQRTLSQVANNFANDCMRTKLPLIYDNEKLVGACLYHASQRTNIPLQLPNGQTYEQMFGLTQANLDDFMAELMKTIYSDAKKGSAEPSEPRQQQPQSATASAAVSGATGPSACAPGGGQSQAPLPSPQARAQAAPQASSGFRPGRPVMLPPPPQFGRAPGAGAAGQGIGQQQAQQLPQQAHAAANGPSQQAQGPAAGALQPTLHRSATGTSLEEGEVREGAATASTPVPVPAQEPICSSPSQQQGPPSPVLSLPPLSPLVGALGPSACSSELAGVQGLGSSNGHAAVGAAAPANGVQGPGVAAAAHGKGHVSPVVSQHHLLANGNGHVDGQQQQQQAHLLAGAPGDAPQQGMSRKRKAESEAGEGSGLGADMPKAVRVA